MEYDLCQSFKNLGYYLLIPIQTVTTYCTNAMGFGSLLSQHCCLKQKLFDKASNHIQQNTSQEEVDEQLQASGARQDKQPMAVTWTRTICRPPPSPLATTLSSTAMINGKTKQKLGERLEGLAIPFLSTLLAICV